MKDEKINSFYARSLIVILLSVLLALLGIHFAAFVLILFPVFFIVNNIQDGPSEGLTNMGVTILIISLVESFEMGVLLAISFVPFTVIISNLIKKRKGNTRILGFSSIMFFISIIAMMAITKVLGVDIVKIIENVSRTMLDTQLEIFKNSGLSNYEFFQIKESLEDAYKQLLLIIPSMLLMLSFIASYINYFISGIILEKLGIKIVNIPKLSKFTLPNDIMLGTLSMFLVTFLAGKLGFSYYKTVFVNIGVLIMMGFFIQGLSVIDFLLNKLKFKLIFKIIFYITFIFNQALVSILTIIGLIDLVFDFRKLRRRTKSQ